MKKKNSIAIGLGALGIITGCTSSGNGNTFNSIDKSNQQTLTNNIVGSIVLQKLKSGDTSGKRISGSLENLLVSQPANITPIVSPPATVNSPVSTPTAVNPPASTPTTVNPPVSTPTAVNPPVSTPTAVNPPVSTPTAVNPPVSTPTTVNPPSSGTVPSNPSRRVASTTLGNNSIDFKFIGGDPHGFKQLNNLGLTGYIEGTNTRVNIGETDGRIDDKINELLRSDGTSKVTVLESNPLGTTHGTSTAQVVVGNTQTAQLGALPDAQIIFGAQYNIGGVINSGAKIVYNSWGTDILYDDLLSTSTPAYINSIRNDYLPLVNSGALIIFSSGNNKANDPEGQPAYPSLVPELKKGWIAASGIAPMWSTGAVYLETGAAEYAKGISDTCGRAKYYCMVASLLKPIFTGTVVTSYSMGTSYAAPAIAAGAGFVQSRYPWMDGSNLRQTLFSTAVDIGAPGVDDVYGWGFLNTPKAVNGPSLFTKILTLDEIDFIANVSKGYDSTFWNDISGDAGLVKNGAGILRLEGNNTYTGSNTVNEGTLIVNGAVTSRSLISRGAVLMSDSAILGSVENNGGTFVNSDTSRIVGDFISNDKSNFVTTRSSLLSVDGKAKIIDTNLIINSPVNEIGDPLYISSRGVKQDILVANGGIEGTFNEVISPLLVESRMVKEEKVDATTLSTVLLRKDVSIVSNDVYGKDATRVNSSENVERALKALDEGRGTEEFRAMAAGLITTGTRATLASTLDSTSGQIHASSQALTFQQSNTINRDITNKLNMLEDSKESVSSVWFNGIGEKGKLYESGYSKGETSLIGGHVGGNIPLGDNLIIGASVAYSDAKAKFDRYGGKSESKDINISVYGRYDINNSLYLQGRLGAGFVDSKVTRETVVNNKVESIEVEHKDEIYSLYGELGYKYKLENDLSVTPYIGVGYDRLDRGSFTEEQSQFGLVAEKKSYDRALGIAGVKVKKDFGKVSLEGYLEQRQALKKQDLSFDASYKGLSQDKFKVKGIRLPKSETWAGLSVVAEVSPQVSLYGNYDAQLERGKINHIGGFGIKINLD